MFAEDCPFDFHTYQSASGRTYKLWGDIKFAALGVAEEAGEVAGNVKKMFRDDLWFLPSSTDEDCSLHFHTNDGCYEQAVGITPARREKVKQEIGDTLYYLARIADEFGLTLEGCAEANLTKIRDRKERGTTHGEGDTR